MVNFLPPEEYYKTVDKRHTGVNGLIFDNRNRLLLVKPSYKDYWQIPGGLTNPKESLMQTMKREIKEELGIEVSIKGFLSMDCIHGRPDFPDSFQIIFEIAALSPDQIKAIKIDNDEIIEYGFYSVSEALTLLGERISKCVAQAVKAKEAKTVFYLENGQNPFGNKA